jgi:predicted nucleic acid-binding protein
MRRLFADSFYWVALCNRKDQWHARVAGFSRSLGGSELVTTDEVLIEVLAHFSESGPVARTQIARFVRDVLDNPAIVVCLQTHQSFIDGLDLYQSRPDKEYSLTDCISMVVMKQWAIDEVLTHDRHFA